MLFIFTGVYLVSFHKAKRWNTISYFFCWAIPYWCLLKNLPSISKHMTPGSA
jgi:hypothetical protein